MSEETKEVPTVARGALEQIVQAFRDLGRNRLALPATVRVHNATKAVREAIQERDELRIALIKQYDEEGQGWEDPSNAPEELIEKVEELMVEEIELNVGPALDFNGDAASVELSPESYGVLAEIGFLGIEGSES